MSPGVRGRRSLSNIQNLQERPNVLRALEKYVLSGGNLCSVLQELQKIIVTPIKAFQRPRAAPPRNDTSDGAPPWATNAEAPTAPLPEKDVVRLFIRVMGKVCIQFLTSRPDKENIISYLQLLEQCQSHEAFTKTQKKWFCSWSWQAGCLLRTFPLGADQQLAPGPARPPPGASPPRHGPGDQPHA